MQLNDHLVSNDVLIVQISCAFLDDRALQRVPKGSHLRHKNINSLLSSIDDSYPSKIKLMRSYIMSGAHIDREVCASRENNKPIRFDPSGEMLPNGNLLRCILGIDSKSIEKLRSYKETSREVNNALSASVLASVRRMGNSMPKGAGIKLVSEYEHSVDRATHFIALSELVKDQMQLADNHFNKSLKSFLEGGIAYKKRVDRNSEVIFLEAFGDLFVVNIGKISVLLTHLHAHRLVDILRSIGFLELGSSLTRFKGVGTTYSEIIKELIEIILPVDADMFGCVLKGCKNVLVASLDTDHIMSNDSASSHLSSLDPLRGELVRECLPVIKSNFYSVEDMINFCNVYKLAPHPDTNLKDLFDSIRGTKDPNYCDNAGIARFNGTMRRAIYRSLTSQGYQVRVNCRTGVDGPGVNLQRETHSTNPPRSKIETSSYTSWNDTTFEQVVNVPNVNSMKTPTASKASMADNDLTLADLREIVSGQLSDIPSLVGQRKKSKIHTINDASESIKGSTVISDEDAIRRFESVVKLHETFEARYPGILPEDIPSDDLEKFLSEEPEATYLVGTEPKFGEYHKKVTRMFYIAERSLKTMTQRIERLGKQVIAKQVGVSITKKHRNRRHDVEDFCNSMTGSLDQQAHVFVSFDMSEFSKRFPMALLRCFGRALAEITGVRWLERIDIVFRASIVVHNTRGYFDFISGVKGGFEGFFNFLWSSIHAVVMEIALDSTGLAGSLLTFGDDGILMFIIRRNLLHIMGRAKINGIFLAYVRYGLVFHLQKTLVSTTVWEYLGDVCYKNHILPMWIKELCTIGRRNINRGIDPAFLKIQGIEAQSDALVVSGADPMLAYIIKHYSSSQIIRRLSPGINQSYIDVLLLIPTSAGGFRIKSPLEMVLRTTLETDAEVLADFIIHEEYDPQIMKKLYGELLNTTLSDANLCKAIMSGTRIQTRHQDSTGYRTIEKMVDLVLDRYGIEEKITQSPLNGEMGERLNTVIPHIRNLSIPMIQSLITSTPEWGAYLETEGIVRGSGCIRLVRRKEIKKLQAQDTKSTQEIIRAWIDAFDETPGIPLDAEGLFAVMERRVFANCNLSPLRPSGRVCLRPTDDQATIEVRVDYSAADSFMSIDYREPHITFHVDFSTMAWSSERGEGVTQRMMRRFADTCCRIISSSPEADDMIRVIASAVGLQVPHAPEAFMRGQHRRRGNRDAGLDAAVMLPRFFMSSSIARYVGIHRHWVYDQERADRTTYLEYARAMAYYWWLRDVRKGDKVEGLVRMYRYVTLDELLGPMHHNAIMTSGPTMPRPFACERISDAAAADYRQTLLENLAFEKYHRSVEDAATPEVRMDDLERRMFNYLSVHGVSRWIQEMARKVQFSIVPELPVPEMWVGMQYIYLKAVHHAAWYSMRIRTRDALTSELKRFLRRARSDLGDEKFFKTSQMTAYMTSLHQSIEIVLNSNLPNVSQLDLEHLKIPSYTTIDEIVEIVREFDLTKPGSITIIKRPAESPGRFTAAHRVAFQSAFSNMVEKIYSIGHESNWDKLRMADTLGLSYDPDEILDSLIVLRGMIRESDHRPETHPYNSRAARIQLTKFYAILWNILRQGKFFRNRDEFLEMANEELNSRVVIRKVRESMRPDADGRGPGPDHERLSGEPLNVNILLRMWVLYEANLHQRRGMPGFNVNANLNYNLSQDDIRGQLTAFYELILRPCINSIVTLPRDLEESLMQRFQPSSRGVAEIMGVEVSPEQFYGEYIASEGLEPRKRNQYASILRSHLEAYIERSGAYGLSRVRNRNREADMLDIAMVGLDDRLGNAIAMSPMHPPNALRCGIIRTDDQDKAMTTYVNLLIRPNAVVTIMRDYYGNGYYITFVYSGEPIELQGNDRSLFVLPEFIGMNVTTELMVPTFTIEEYAASSATSLSSRKSSVGGPNIRSEIPSLQIIANSMHTLQLSSQVIESSHLLLAAKELAMQEPTPNSMLGAYAGTILALQNVDRVELIAPTSLSILRKLTNEFETQAVKNDIAITWSWLILSRLAPGIRVDHEKVLAAMAQMKRVTPPFAIPLTIQARRPRPFELSVALLHNNKPDILLGLLSTFLYEEAQAAIAAVGEWDGLGHDDLLNEANNLL